MRGHCSLETPKAGVHDRSRRPILLAVALLVLVTTACPRQPSRPIEIDVAVDDTLLPVDIELPVFGDGQTRVLGALAAEDGRIASFVVDEVVVVSEDRQEIDAFVDRHQGKVLFVADADELGLIETPHMALVRVTTDDVELSSLGDDLATVAAARHGLTDLPASAGAASIEMRFSSEAAARLMAVVMAELRAGVEAGVNFVMESAAIPGDTEEAPTATGFEDAYAWAYWNRGGDLDIGVPEAWDLLYHADRLDAEIDMAFLDGGFSPSRDCPAVRHTHVHGGSGIDQENPSKCGDSDCPWHGTAVVSAAAARPDNRFGAAGTAGPVARPIFIQTPVDVATANLALYRAESLGASIINMSFINEVHWSADEAIRYARENTRRLRNKGILLFAGAGNDGRSVDLERCLGESCWERHFFYPCESPGVICVGGLNDGGGRADGSNYGANSVRLWAPMCVNVGPDPDDAGANILKRPCGTSMASPFAAGIAALVMAARPNARAEAVWSTLESTAREWSGIRQVDAYRAVLGSIGTAFTARITSPPDGAELPAGIPVHLSGTLSVVSVPSGSTVQVSERWTSSRDGELRARQFDVSRDDPNGYNTAATSWSGRLSEGLHVINLATQANWFEQGLLGRRTVIRSDQVVLSVVNSPPEVEILGPADGAEFCPGQAIAFRGRGRDLNESLPESAFRWTAGRGVLWPLRRLGEGPTVLAANLESAEYSVTVTVTDSGGLRASDSIVITILDAADPQCLDLRPTALIVAPGDGAVFTTQGLDGIGPYVDLDLEGRAHDREDDDATLKTEWFASTNGKLGEGTRLTARVHMTEQLDQKITLTFRVTDSDNKVAQDRVEVFFTFPG